MMKKVIICGTRFGQFYIEALKNIQDIEIVGILANGSERSIKCAEYYRLKLFVEIDSLPKDIDFACVAVGSSVFGGNGIYIAKELLKRGVNVIFEQPIHSREIAELYNMSILTNEKFSIGNLYNNLPAVKSFLLNVSIANKIDQPSYIMIDLNTQLSYP
ncbi:TPA: Gfo/Idh/MocA family oxidoreductase, partial [Streptococcus equi subsp. equi]|nr:Gfo/Idh/MocA family oxidoreductase [Streptococcus equi subsp. equi]HEK9712152.1 Gfo/Idh/MocA family oxidoreductase [Streptococcus equi subsp. equi]